MILKDMVTFIHEMQFISLYSIHYMNTVPSTFYTLSLHDALPISSFSLEDATGGRWEYNSKKEDDWKLRSGDVIIFNGHDVRLNKTTIMERTNRYYPIIKEGLNKFKIRGISNYKITFDFRFKYY